MSILHVVSTVITKEMVNFPNYKISRRRRILLEYVMRMLLLSYLICPCVVIAYFHITSDRVAEIAHVRDDTYIIGNDTYTTYLFSTEKPVYAGAPQAIYGSKYVDIIRGTFCVTALYWIFTTVLVWIPIVLYMEGDDFYGDYSSRGTQES